MTDPPTSMEVENNPPLFSIVIPTKNRPVFLVDAIDSVLLQSFKDFELIVSDNFNEQPTVDVINRYNDHPRFNSYRTNRELNMVDHWEFATRKAQGHYVIVLADRKVLTKGALELLSEKVKKHPKINIFSFRTRVYNENENKLGWRSAPIKENVYSSELFIRNFLFHDLYSTDSLDCCFPKTLNGCYRNTFAQEVREKYGRYFNNQGVTTPDFSSLFVNLALNKEIVYISSTVLLTQGELTSNGRNFNQGRFEDYMTSLNIEDPYRYSPIKVPFIYNLLINDFCVIKDKCGGNLADYEISLNNLFRTCKRELELKEPFLEKPTYQYFENGLKMAEVGQTENPPAPLARDFLNKFKMSKNYIEQHLIDYLYHNFRNSRWLNRLFRYQHRNVLEAAGFIGQR